MRTKWEDLLQSLKMSFDPEKFRHSNIVLMGAGRKGELALQAMRAEGYRMAAFTDNDPAKWSENSRRRGIGLPVIPPEKIRDIPDAAVVITAAVPFYHEIRRQLDRLGYLNLTHMELMLLTHEPDYRKVYTEYLEDQKSRDVFWGVLSGHLSGEEKYFKDIYEDRQYFAIPEFDQILKNEVFADCGASVGDTVETYMMRKSGVFRKIYAFEPVRGSFLALERRVQRLNMEWNFDGDRIGCFNYAVGEKTAEGAVSVCEDTAASSHASPMENGDGSEKVQIIALDDFFEGRDEVPTFIKADIEGEELRMLRGARKLIAEHKPRLAISIYHKDEDLYELPMEIKKLNPSYKFAMRQHKPQFSETVLYCW